MTGSTRAGDKAPAGSGRHDEAATTERPEGAPPAEKEPKVEEMPTIGSPDHAATPVGAPKPR